MIANLLLLYCILSVYYVSKYKISLYVNPYLLWIDWIPVSGIAFLRTLKNKSL